jgi:prepilin-type processing-associated H-X9-DG protein
MNEEIRIIDPTIAESFFERNRLYFDIGLHLVLLMVAVSPFVMLYLKRKTTVSRRDLYWLVAALIAVPTGAVYAQSILPTYTIPFVRGYTTLSCIVLSISMLVVSWRLKKQSSGSYALTIIGSLLLLGLSMGLMLPAVPSAREAARRMACANNLKQLGLGIHLSKDAGIDLTNAQTSNSPEVEGGPDVSWRVKLLPFVEQSHLKEAYRSEQPWDSDANWELAQKRLSVYSCPSEPPQMNPKGGRYTSYAMLNHSNRQEDKPKSVQPRNAARPNTNGIMLMESCGANLIWTEPRDVDLDTFKWSLQPENEAVRRMPWNSRNIGSSLHPHGTQAAFVDGSVRFLSETTDPELLRRLISGEASVDEVDF